MTPFSSSKPEHRQQLLHHINSQDPHIQFTVEEPSQQGWLPFLDTLITLGLNQNLHTTVYRKPTHTDQYLHLGQQPYLSQQNKVYITHWYIGPKLFHTIRQELNKELEHIKKALQACQFPPWALKQLQGKFNRKQIPGFTTHNWNSTNTDNSNNNNHNNITIGVPHIQGIGENFKKACHSRGIQVHFKGTNITKNPIS